MRARTAFLVCLLILASVVVHPQSRPADVIGEQEAYDIYAMLLAKLDPVTTAHAKTIIIQAESATSRECMPKGKPLEEDWRSVVDDFTRQNSRVVKLSRRFPSMPVLYRLVKQSEIQRALRRPGYWRTFYAKFPDSGGYHAVSAVGFNEQKTRAMVYVEYLCDVLCGSGAYRFLEKHDGQWTEVRLNVNNCVWVS
jgi:hypothetical protein